MPALSIDSLKTQGVLHFLSTKRNSVVSEAAKWITNLNILHGKICQQLLLHCLPCVTSSGWVSPSTLCTRVISDVHSGVRGLCRQRPGKSPVFGASHTAACSGCRGSTLRSTRAAAFPQPRSPLMPTRNMCFLVIEFPLGTTPARSGRTPKFSNWSFPS